MNEKSYIRVNNVPVQEGAPKALIGAGTGLGECLLTKSKAPSSKYYDIFPCEGGHTDFAPRTDFEFGYMMKIKEDLKLDRVSVERCVSGMSLLYLFNYLKETIPDIKTTLDKPDNKVIIEKGLDGSDKICSRVIDEFLSLYGAEAGNLCLKILPFGGLYLLSGLTQALKDKIIKEKTFMNNFLRKGRMQSLLEKVPIFIVDENIGLDGAEEAANRMI